MIDTEDEYLDFIVDYLYLKYSAVYAGVYAKQQQPELPQIKYYVGTYCLQNSPTTKILIKFNLQTQQIEEVPYELFTENPTQSEPDSVGSTAPNDETGPISGTEPATDIQPEPNTTN